MKHVRERPKIDRTLLLLLLLGAALRLATCRRYPFMDETSMAGGTVLHFIAAGAFRPAHFAYPTLYYYLTTPVTWVTAKLMTAAL